MTSMEAPLIITGAQLATDLRGFLAHSVNTPMIVDESFLVPTKEWLMDEFCPVFKKFLAAYKAQVWTKKRNDCDNFSTLFQAMAQIANHGTPGAPEAALSVGFMHFTADGAGGIYGRHAAVIAEVWSNGEREIITIEPQDQKETKLKGSEKLSCDIYYFG